MLDQLDQMAQTVKMEHTVKMARLATQGDRVPRDVLARLDQMAKTGVQAETVSQAGLETQDVMVRQELLVLLDLVVVKVHQVIQGVLEPMDQMETQDEMAPRENRGMPVVMVHQDVMVATV